MTAIPNTENHLEWALFYAANGWSVFPVHGFVLDIETGEIGCTCGNAECDAVAKHPVTADGFKSATTDPARIRAWWTENPHYNIGTPDPSVVDIDDMDAMTEKSWAPLRGKGTTTRDGEHVTVGGSQPVAKTGGGGEHHFFEPGAKIVTLRQTGYGYEIRGDGSYVVLPPSVHASGNRYEWVVPPRAELGKFVLMALPTMPVKARDKATSSGQQDVLRRQMSLMGIDSGRNTLLTSLVGMAAKTATSFDELRRKAHEYNGWFGVPLPAREVDAMCYASGRKWVSEAPFSLDRKFLMKRTDPGNAERLVQDYGDYIRYVPKEKKWLIWDGKRWARDESNMILQLAIQTLRGRHREAELVYDLALRDAEEYEARLRAAGKSPKHTPQEYAEGARSKFRGFLKSSESLARLNAMVTIAATAPEVTVHPDELDADPYVINCRNGTVDLRTGELREHNQADLITRVVDVDYKPEAKAPEFQRFLESAQPDAEVRALLQRLAGYTMIGRIDDEQIFVLNYGEGSNGKSTLLNVMQEVLGEYHRAASSETILARESGKHKEDIARLAGARMVTSIEVDDGKYISEALVKSITDGTRQTARFMYGDTFEFTPRFTLWVATNFLPRTNADNSIMRRIVLIKWLVNFEKRRGEVDKQLGARIIANEREGVLAWMVAGALDYMRRGGLDEPQCVQEWRDEYERDQDHLSRFIDECVIEAPDGKSRVKRTEMYAAARRWYNDEGLRVPTAQVFHRRMRQKGYHQERKQILGERGYFYADVTLTSDAQEMLYRAA